MSRPTVSIPTEPKRFGVQAADVLHLPILLPTARLAWLEVPRFMSEADFDWLYSRLQMVRDAIVTNDVGLAPQEQGSGI